MLSILAYNAAMFFLWTAFDIKLIRNKLLNIPETQNLKDFIKKEKHDDDDTDDTIKLAYPDRI